MKNRLFVTTLVLFCLQPAFAKNSKGSQDPAILKQSTSKYRNAKLVQMDLEKKVKSELTGKESIYKGTIYLSTGLFRMVLNEPEKSTIVFDGSTVWNEQPPSVDFPGPTQVTKARLNSKTKSQTVFATLLTKEPVSKNFKILKSDNEGDLTVVTAEPLTSDLSVKTLVVKINNKTKEVGEISYRDDIGNETSMKFTNPQFKKSLDKKIFQYKPPKDAQVTEI